MKGGEKHVIRSQRKRSGSRRICTDPRPRRRSRDRHSCPAWACNRKHFQQCDQQDLNSSFVIDYYYFEKTLL